MFDTWSDGKVLTLIEDSHRQTATTMARKLAGISELLERRMAEELDREADIKSMITGFNRTVIEVAAAMHMTSAKARTLVRRADALHHRLPAVGALLAAGELDWDTAELVCSRTDLVHEHLMPQLDAKLATDIRGWSRWSRKHVTNAIDAAVNTLDADAAKQRRVTAFDERNVTIDIGLDGVARVRATLSAKDGAALDALLCAMAKAVCASDPRSFKQRRADAFAALKHGHLLACTCDSEHCPNRGGQHCPPTDDTGSQPEAEPRAEAESAAQAVPEAEAESDDPATPAVPTPAPQSAPAPSAACCTQVVLNVIAGADTVTGHSNAPGYLAGFGVIDAELVRELAREATRRLVEEPVFDQRQALTYRPSAALARFIRARDLFCRFPGCTVPAHRCDIDHTEPFNHDDPAAGGQTVPWNLACYCREHHRHKTFDDGWHDRQLPDATIVWTSPTGRTYRTTPGGAQLFPDLIRERRPEDLKRVEAARKRLHQHRHTSAYNRHRNRAAKEEVRLRCWRNEFRRWRALFHGAPTSVKPSTSPFARFVNDPIEPEQLPPNWQPPPLTFTNPDPDEPPPF